MTSYRQTIGRRWVIRPSPELFTPDFRPSRRIVSKAEFHLGRGSGQSKTTSLRLIEIQCD